MTGLRNEPGEQQVGGDDGWIYFNTYTQSGTENGMQQSPTFTLNTESPPCVVLQEEREVRGETGFKVIVLQRGTVA